MAKVVKMVPALKRHPELSDRPYSDKNLPDVLLRQLREDAEVIGAVHRLEDGRLGRKFRVTIRTVVEQLYGNDLTDHQARNVASNAARALKDRGVLVHLENGNPATATTPRLSPLYFVADDDGEAPVEAPAAASESADDDGEPMESPEPEPAATEVSGLADFEVQELPDAEDELSARELCRVLAYENNQLRRSNELLKQQYWRLHAAFLEVAQPLNV